MNRERRQCAICGGEVRETAIGHQEQRGGRFYLFENVPAGICGACEEIWIDDATLVEMEHLIRHGQPARTIETPVFDLAPRT